MDSAQFMPDEQTIAGIRRDIEAYEAERARAYKHVLWRVPVFVGGALAAIVILAVAFNAFAGPYEQWFSTPHVFLYAGAMLLLIAAYRTAMKRATELRQSFRDRVLPIVLGFVKDVNYRNGVTPVSVDRIPSQATGKYGRSTFDDVIAGTFEGFPFELYEARLSTGGKDDTELFKGVIIGFQTETAFPGVLVAVRKSGPVSKFFRDIFRLDKLHVLACGNPFLDDMYEFHTDNPDAARPLLTGKLAKALVWLSEAWPNEPARVALKDRDGFLLLPLTKNFFELPGIRTPLAYTKHIAPIVADMVSLLATAALVRRVGAPHEEVADPAR